MSARSKSHSMSLRLIRRRRKSAHRNSLNGVVSFANPPTRLNHEVAHRFRNILVVATTTLVVKRMHPPAIVENLPKSIRVDHAKVGDNRNQHVFDALLVKCARQVMMIYNIKAITGSQDNWNHVFAEKLRSFLVLLRAPAFPLSLDFAHAYGNLGWAQVGDAYRLKNGFADRHHWMLLYMQSLVYSWGLTARPLA